MTEAVVRVETPEEREYTRYLVQVEERRRRVADLRAEIESLKLILGRFEAEYHARVGRLFVDLDRVRLAIDEYERRIAALRIDPAANPKGVEDDVAREFRQRHDDVRSEEEDTRRYEQAFARDQERPPLNPESESEMRRLYYDLARRFHPDTARTEDERRLRVPIMQRINAAFRDRDLSSLRAILAEAEVVDPAFEAKSIGEKLVWAIREVARIDGVISQLGAELVSLRATDSHNLWLRQKNGEAVIEQLEEDLNEDLTTLRERLATLVETYRRLIGERVA